MSQTTTSRVRSVAVVAASALLGGALGIGGASFALWEDAVSLDGQIGSGYEYFAAGFDGQTAAATDPSVTVSIGSTQAETLLEDGELALVLQTDSLSQGNKGLHYAVTEPDWGSNIFGAAEVSLYWVAAPDQCDPDLDPGTPPATVDGLASTPVSAGYSDTETPTTEYWCLVATLGSLPDEGSYTNEVTATGTDPAGTAVADTDSWSADVASALDPAEEDDHEITFTYQTFRPGQEP